MPEPIIVSSLLQLYDALASATGGETILLNGGDYGNMFLGTKTKFDITFPSNVTIASADPGNPAVFSGLDIRGAANLTFDGIKFDYEFTSGDQIWLRPFSVSGASNITIRNSTFDGDVAEGVSKVSDGYGFAIGLSFRGSTGVSLENNEFFDFHRGIVIGESADVTVRGNDVHSIRMDGMNFSQITGAVIEDNYIHDFRGSPDSGDHRDMIQFWTAGTDAPSTDITIRNNHLDIGDGTSTQSIFMRNDLVDRGIAGAEMFYRDIVIENNVIVNGHAHGITVGETNGLTIRNNSVLHADGQTAGTGALVEIPRINISKNSTDVTIAQNATAGINGHEGQSDWTVRDNAFVQDRDPNAPGYYGDVFISTSMESVEGVHDFRALPGGLLNSLPAGASFTIGPMEAPGLSTHFQTTNADNNVALRHFDASFCLQDQKSLPEGTKFHWDFGDGATATGMQVSHAFSGGGVYDVGLTVELPNGQSQTRYLSVGVSGPNVMSYNAQDGLTAYKNGEPTIVNMEGSVTSEGIHLGGKGSAAHIDRAHVAGILRQDEFSLSMTLTSGSTQSSGEVMRLHSSFIVSVTSTGELNLRAFGAGGEDIRLTTKGANLTDKTAHDINISLDDGLLAISVDGSTLASAPMTVPLADAGNHNLTFGNPWNAKNFDGLLSTFEVTANESHFPIIAPASDEAALRFDDTPLEMPDFSSNILSYTAQDGLTAFEGGNASAVDMEGTVSSDGIHLGGTGSASHIDRAHVADILGQDAFSLSMTLTSGSTQSSGEVMRLHSSFIVSVTSAGELNLRTFGEGGEQIRLTTKGANLVDMAAHDIDISLDGGLLAISVDGNTLASAQMTAPLADVGRHDLTFGNPWNAKNFDGLLSTFEVTANESHFPIIAPASDEAALRFDDTPLEMPDFSSNILSYTAQDGLTAFQDGNASAVDMAGAVSSDGIHLGGTGSASHIDRAHVADILGQDAFSLSMTLTSGSTQSSGEVMRLHSSFIVSVTSAGELNLRTFGEGGEQIRLTTKGANLVDMAAHDIDISLDGGLLAISVDGNTLASAQMTAPLADVGRHDLTFGNPWNAKNFDGLLSTLKIAAGDGPFSDAGGRSYHEAAMADVLFDDVLPQAPDATLPLFGQNAVAVQPTLDAWSTAPEDVFLAQEYLFKGLLSAPLEDYFL